MIHDPLSGYHFDRIIELPSVNYSRIALQQSNPQIKIIEINTMFAQAFLPFMPNISKATKVVLTKPSHSKPIAFCEQEDQLLQEGDGTNQMKTKAFKGSSMANEYFPQIEWTT